MILTSIPIRTYYGQSSFSAAKMLCIMYSLVHMSLLDYKHCCSKRVG